MINNINELMNLDYSFLQEKINRIFDIPLPNNFKDKVRILSCHPIHDILLYCEYNRRNLTIAKMNGITYEDASKYVVIPVLLQKIIELDKTLNEIRENNRKLLNSISKIKEITEEYYD